MNRHRIRALIAAVALAAAAIVVVVLNPPPAQADYLSDCYTAKYATSAGVICMSRNSSANHLQRVKARVKCRSTINGDVIVIEGKRAGEPRQRVYAWCPEDFKATAASYRLVP